jgi:asparagine synthase (glutamine-hydrolysing)
LNTSSNIKEAIIVEMCDSIKHRGPDGEGYAQSAHFNSLNKEFEQSFEHKRAFQLGHRRLSIIDLSTSAGQPMIDQTGKYILVFNGEIYNHVELRKELEKDGVKFRTSHSDTEVLLNGLIHEGKSFLQKLNGMFSFCFMDLENDYTLLVRDRLGIKPFYYSVINGALYFASEVKALRQVEGFNLQIDETSLFDYLVFSSVKAPKTLFQGTFKLEPAHLIELKGGEMSKSEAYWDLKTIPKRESNFNDDKEALLNHFDQAAQRRMIADVEVGVLLSGGVDSTANLGMLTKHSNKPISAFSIGFDNEQGYQNEFEYARIAAKHFNADYHEIKLSYQDYLDDLLATVGFQDMPIADSANAMIYRIAAKAKESGITVLLGGEGADELLIGYSYWSFAAKYQSLLKDSKSKAALISGFHSLPGLNKKRAVYRDWYPKTKQGYTHFTGGTETRTPEAARKLLNPDIQKRLSSYSPLDQIQKMYNEFQGAGEYDYYDWMTYLDLNHRLPELLLARLDRMSMGASIEGRVPFLDHEFAEFCFSMPSEHKFQNETEKYILKKSFEGMIPNEILYRPKAGFQLPLNQIMMSKKEELNQELICANKEFGMFAEASSLSDESNGHQNYNLANLSIWANQL